ncbi:MAG: GNAT family N-acetyltransferase [Candidatus Heimdallarchaeota archaeon]|nr:GNAT family N-acetyltransferase [Candidatus Heimdallarchaeota archaeon]
MSRNSIIIRSARIDDSESLSQLHSEYIDNFQVFEQPTSAEKYRLAIGSSYLKRCYIHVVEEDTNIIGFIEQYTINDKTYKISYPIVKPTHSDRIIIQKKLINRCIENIPIKSNVTITIEISANNIEANKFISNMGFQMDKTILQIWEGFMEPLDDVSIEPYEIKEVKKDHLDTVYSWIERQLDKESPLYLSKQNFYHIVNENLNTDKGWAMAFVEDIPVAFISSIVDVETKTAVIFGPYNDDSYIDVRLSLLNELVVYYLLKGIDYFRVLRIDTIDDDYEIFQRYGLSQIEKIQNYKLKLM